MTTNHTTATDVREPPPTGYSEDTSRRILAYLASVRSYDGETEAYYRGYELIARMAVDAAQGGDRWLIDRGLSAAECADVLHFVHSTYPLERSTWWDDPQDAPSHVVGFHIVLETVEKHLRAAPMEVRQ